VWRFASSWVSLLLCGGVPESALTFPADLPLALDAPPSALGPRLSALIARNPTPIHGVYCYGAVFGIIFRYRMTGGSLLAESRREGRRSAAEALEALMRE